MSNCDNAIYKVFHPLQRVLMENTTEEYACSLTVDFAGNVTDQAAHKLGQLSNLKQLV